MKKQITKIEARELYNILEAREQALRDEVNHIEDLKLWLDKRLGLDKKLSPTK